MASEEGVKGNKKGVPVWTFVKNASLAITIFLFFFTIVLVLDAYKFVSVRVSIRRYLYCILQFVVCNYYAYSYMPVCFSNIIYGFYLYHVYSLFRRCKTGLVNNMHHHTFMTCTFIACQICP